MERGSGMPEPRFLSLWVGPRRDVPHRVGALALQGEGVKCLDV
jgi:hypothetical protein